MRHEQIADQQSYSRVDVVALWPKTSQMAPPPASEPAPTIAGSVFLPTPSAPDVPAAAGGLLVASYGGLILAFALVTAGSARSIFAVAICAAFVAIFFALPRIFLAAEPKQGHRVTLDYFLRNGMETLTGHSSGGAALIQMLMVPTLLTLGMVLIGIARAFLI
jgi:hypothetical protein